MKTNYNAIVTVSDIEIKEFLAEHFGVDKTKVTFFLREEGDQRDNWKVLGGANISMTLPIPNKTTVNSMRNYDPMDHNR